MGTPALAIFNIRHFYGLTVFALTKARRSCIVKIIKITKRMRGWSEVEFR